MSEITDSVKEYHRGMVARLESMRRANASPEIITKLENMVSDAADLVAQNEALDQ